MKIQAHRISNEFNFEETEISRLEAQFAAEIGIKEEELIKAVLHQYLGREATIEDINRCTKFYRTDISLTIYDLAYDNVKLGIVKFNQSPLDYQGSAINCKCTITFIPCQ